MFFAEREILIILCTGTTHCLIVWCFCPSRKSPCLRSHQNPSNVDPMCRQNTKNWENCVDNVLKCIIKKQNVAPKISLTRKCEKSSQLATKGEWWGLLWRCFIHLLFLTEFHLFSWWTLWTLYRECTVHYTVAKIWKVVNKNNRKPCM